MRLLLALLLLLPLPALADELRVTINVPAGQTPLEYRLEGADVRSFWQRWSRLPETEAMVPLSAGGDYAGLLIRVPNSEKQVRLFSGVGSGGDVSRADDLRMLERWVLAKAPPPLGPVLLTALDQQVQQQAAATGTAPPQKPRSGMQLIMSCRARANRNHTLRARCLEEALKEQSDAKAYADALEKVATGLLP